MSVDADGRIASAQIQGRQLRTMYSDFFATVEVKQLEDSTTHVQISRGGELRYAIKTRGVTESTSLGVLQRLR
jgi:hypothetical protein